MPYCTKCGTEYVEGDSFCKVCGASLDREQLTVIPAEEETKKTSINFREELSYPLRNKKALGIGAVIVIIVTLVRIALDILIGASDSHPFDPSFFNDPLKLLGILIVVFFQGVLPFGYLVKVVRETFQSSDIPPNWTDISRIILDGTKIQIIIVSPFLIPAIFGLLFYLFVSVLIAISWMISLIIFLAWGLILAMFGPFIISRFANEDSMKSAFHIKRIVKFAINQRKDYIIAFLLLILAELMPALFGPVIGSLIQWYLFLYLATIFAKIYMNAVNEIGE